MFACAGKSAAPSFVFILIIDSSSQKKLFFFFSLAQRDRRLPLGVLKEPCRCFLLTISVFCFFFFLMKIWDSSP